HGRQVETRILPERVRADGCRRKAQREDERDDGNGPAVHRGSAPRIPRARSQARRSFRRRRSRSAEVSRKAAPAAFTLDHSRRRSLHPADFARRYSSASETPQIEGSSVFRLQLSPRSKAFQAGWRLLSRAASVWSSLVGQSSKWTPFRRASAVTSGSAKA